jgi:organic hydroperoxide reductase OsmC/OhrA
LLLSAVGLCLETTFQVFAAKEGLAVPRYSSLVQGVLEKTPAGIVFTSITAQVELTVAADAFATAERLLHSAKKYCIVSNSLKTPVDLRVSLAAA